MPLYGEAPQSIAPGQIGTFMGIRAIPSTPIVAANESIPATVSSPPSVGASRPVVIAANVGGHGSTQRQIIWRVFGTVAVNINLEASIDDVPANYVVVDNYTGTGNSGARVIQADLSTADGPQAQSVAKIVSSARFWRVTNAGATAVSITADMTCQ